MTNGSDIASCVVPIFGSPHHHWFCGTAFCIDGFLITAGHVLSRPKSYFTSLEGQLVELLPQRWTPKLVVANDRLEFDVAIYPFPGLKSALSLADFYDDEPQEELQLLCWQRKPQGLVEVRTRGISMGDTDEEAYFKLATVEQVFPGCSGCPVFDANGIVHGIVTMVNTQFKVQQQPWGITPHERDLMQTMGERTCWVFKASHIRRFLPPT